MTFVSQRLGDLDRKLLVEAFEEPSELLSLLKACMELEHQLGVLLQDVTGIDTSDFQLATKIQLFRSLRLPGEHWRAIDDFRRLRNKFAHQKSASLELHKDIVTSILGRPSPLFRTMRGTTFELVDVDGETRQLPYDLMDERQKLVVIAMQLSAYLRVLPEMFEFPLPIERVRFLDTHEVAS